MILGLGFWKNWVSISSEASQSSEASMSATTLPLCYLTICIYLVLLHFGCKLFKYVWSLSIVVLRDSLLVSWRFLWKVCYNISDWWEICCAHSIWVANHFCLLRIVLAPCYKCWLLTIRMKDWTAEFYMFEVACLCDLYDLYRVYLHWQSPFWTLPRIKCKGYTSKYYLIVKWNIGQRELSRRNLIDLPILAILCCEPIETLVDCKDCCYYYFPTILLRINISFLGFDYHIIYYFCGSLVHCFQYDLRKL